MTNGTSTANKIVEQALIAPGDIVLVDRNCHQSHHYGLLMSGAQNHLPGRAPPQSVLDVWGVPLREIKSRLLALRAAGKLDRVKLLTLTNCTFDGIVYDVERVMEECLAIKPDLVFLWDEAWFAFARFHHIYCKRTAMHAARAIRERLRSPEYRRAYLEYAEQVAGTDDETLLEQRLMPEPAGARVRVYATQSTHKTLTSLRQGSMIHVFDQDFDQKVRGALPRGVHGAHLDLAELSDSGFPRHRPPASRSGGRGACPKAGRKRDATARRDRQAPIAEQVHALPVDGGDGPGAVPPPPALTSRCAPVCAT